MDRLNRLPFEVNLNTVEILQLLSNANYAIGELKGVINTLTNPNIILSLLHFSESKDSSEIEEIHTTLDEIFIENVNNNGEDKAAKEVARYKKAMLIANEFVRKHDFISTRMLVEIQEIIEGSKPGIRKIPGTVIKNTKTDEIVHLPPQNEDEIRECLDNLEKYINYDIEEYDDLIKMALIHFQFESIHPFYDGNGRVGRILNIAYLVLKGKIDSPVLYLSKYINENRSRYYELLRQSNSDISEIPSFVMFILNAILETSNYTINLIHRINNEFDSMSKELKKDLPKIYSRELVEHLFEFMYTTNRNYRTKMSCSRNKASSDLQKLVDGGYLMRIKIGKEVFFKNLRMESLISD